MLITEKIHPRRFRLLLSTGIILIWVGLLPALYGQEKSVNPVPLKEAYDSWKLAKKETGLLTAPSTIYAPEGFEVEMLKSATESEGSWVGMAFDKKGRLYIAIEKQGILRLIFSKDGPITTELVDSELLECRGLLWAHDSLYANANNSKGLYRLRDTDGDDKFDEKTLLLETTGGVGHGRNHLRLGPDGLIYIVHGNDVALSPKTFRDSPLKNYEEDQLIPNPWDNEWFNKRSFVPAGHILRTDKDGSYFELFAGGMRNPLDIDFNQDGEPFVYEADMEWESGLAWYKPTRVLHIVSGGDYGWRRATGKWPAYYEDSLPAAYDVGLGSPTGVEFGYRSNFPEKWRNSLFILDWSYGRIIATHLAEQGASYIGTGETFILGRPLNVTDIAFGPDGSMYFTTGGRRTQSALYRVKWTGEKVQPVVKKKTNQLRELRKQLEVWHVKKGYEGGELAKQHIDHPDRWIRFAARVALENQFPNQWMEWAKESQSSTAIMALARMRLGSTGELVGQLSKIPFEKEPLTLLRAYHLVFSRCGEPDEKTRQLALQHLSAHYPADSAAINHELCELMVYLRAPNAMSVTLDLLDAAETTEDLSQYLCFSRYLFESEKYTDDELLSYNRRYLQGLRRMENFSGGRWFDRTVTNLQKEAEARLNDAHKTALAEWLKSKGKPVPPTNPGTVEFVAEWRMADFDEAIERPLENRNYKNGKLAFHKAKCDTCHRAGGIETSPPANLGPDLKGLGARFGIADMLESMIHPSRVIGDKYRNPAGPNISLMPPGQINVLDRESVLDLLAFLQSGGEKDDPVFQSK